jgi:hypothetical protein
VALAVVLVACSPATPSAVPSSASSPGPTSSGGASPGSTAGAPSLPDPSAIFNSTAPPIDLTVTTETDNTVTATIPTAGGEMSATGADGTVYTLAIPDDALLVPTQITMTPVATIAGLPTSGEATHAVQLGPDGLHLEDFAILTITPTTDIPVDQQIAFGYEGGGKAMFLALPVVKDPRIQVRILHFSGYAVTKGLLASLDEVRKQLGGDADARLSSYLASFLAKERALEMSGHETPSDYWDAFDDILDAYERDVVEPRVAAAGKSCATARLAWESVQNLARQRQLLPSEKPAPDTEQLQTTLAHVCTQEEYEICRDDHVVHRMLTVILGFERQRQLPGGHEDEAEWAFEKATAKKCLTFEVRFLSTATGTEDPIDIVSKVKATVTISLDTETLAIKGESALINTALELRQTVKSDCVVKSLRGGSVFKVLDVKFDATPSKVGTADQPGDPGKLKDIALTYLPTETTDNGTIKCPHTPIRLLAGPFWSALYLGTHASERGTPDGAYTTKEWKVSDRAAKLGTKDWDYSFPAVHWTDEGTFELHHRPS